MKFKDILLALLVVVIWGVNFTAIKIGLNELPPILFSALRFAVVAIPAVFFISFPKTSVWNVLSVGLFLGVIKFSLLFVAMNTGVSAGLSSLLLQAQVLFTIALSFLFFKEPLGKNQVAGLLISLLGFSSFVLNAGGNFTLWGITLILLAAFSWAISNLVMKQMQEVNLLNFMVWVSLVPPVPLLALSYYLETDAPVDLIISTTMPTWLSVAYVGFISTLLAFAIWGKLLQEHKAATVTPFALLIPVAGLLTSNIVLNETLNSTEVIGAILIMAGLILCVLGNKIKVILGQYTKGIFADK